MKLVLGTVQFGLDYGISNSGGKIPEAEVGKILDLAHENGIDTLDTAYNYGESEKVIGRYIEKSGKKFKLISKIPKENPDKINQIFETSLSNLHANELYAYLFHDFNSFKSQPELLNILKEYKKAHKIEKIGFSLYFPEELEYLLANNVEFDIVQVPYSLFDQRFEKYLTNLKKQGKEIHVRSVFLQGLVFRDPNSLESHFEKVKPKLTKLRDIAKKADIDLAALCQSFVALNPSIDKIVIGVENKQNLIDNISYLSAETENKVKNFYDELKALREDDLNIILPINWKK